MDSNDALLEVRGLKTHFFLDEGVVKAVDGVDLKVRAERPCAWSGERLRQERHGPLHLAARGPPRTYRGGRDPLQPHTAE